MSRTPLDEIGSLVQRAPVLDACRDGPVGRPTIAERADCSRATAYRATGSLEERGLLEKVANGYRLTGFGRSVLRQIELFRSGLDGTATLRPVLTHVDAPELAANADLFTDATVVQSTPDAPYSVDQHIASIIESTEESMTGLTSSFASPSVMAATYEVIRSGVDVEWVLTQSAFDGVRRQHNEGHDELMTFDTTTTYIVEQSPLDIGIYDETLVVAGFDDESGIVAAVATTDDDAAVEWGKAVVTDHKARGAPLD